MKASEAVSHEKSKRWKVRGYADRLAQLGPVEVAVYAKTRRENLMRLLKNGFFWSWVNQFFFPPTFLIFIISENTKQIIKIICVVLTILLVFSYFIGIYVLVKYMKTPRFAVCERGLWLDRAAFSWESIENCYWNRFKENELIVKSGKAFILTAIPADRREEVEAAIRKRDKMKPLVAPTD